MMWEQVAESIVNQMRAIHINVTMDEWVTQRSRGNLNDEVAIIVDGSPTRPIKNVKFAGVIDIMAPPSVELMIEAAEFAYKWMIAWAHKVKGPTSGDQMRKGRAGRGYRYHQDFEVFVSDKVRVNDPSVLRNDSYGFTNRDWISIMNFAPYAAKHERYRYPGGVYNQVFKKLRSKYGALLAIRWDYVESTESQHNMTSEKGVNIPTPQPVLRIGPAGAFPSRKPNIRKYTKDRPTSAAQRSTFKYRKG